MAVLVTTKKRLTQLREAFLSLADAAIHFHADQTI